MSVSVGFVLPWLPTHISVAYLLLLHVHTGQNFSDVNAKHTKADTKPGQTFLWVFAAVLESQAFGPFQARQDSSQAQPSGAKSETPGHIGGVQLDAATPAGHAMQQATHAEGGGPAGPGEGTDLKAVITDWLEKVFLPAINAEVHVTQAHVDQRPTMVPGSSPIACAKYVSCELQEVLAFC